MQITTKKAEIGIIGAMDIEIEEILKEMLVEEEKVISSIKYYFGSFAGVKCVVSKCSAGKVNSAICAQTMILEFSPRILINIGVAGGIEHSVHISDLVIATACIQHDYDTSLLDTETPRGFVWGIDRKEIPCDEAVSNILFENAKNIYGAEKVHRGIVVTGDQFISSSDKSAELQSEFSALACEMEGASIAHVCCANGVPVAVLRAISDNANDSGDVDFLEFAKAAASNAQKLLTQSVGQI